MTALAYNGVERHFSWDEVGRPHALVFKRWIQPILFIENIFFLKGSIPLTFKQTPQEKGDQSIPS
jgi:hypothetical protein